MNVITERYMLCDGYLTKNMNMTDVLQKGFFLKNHEDECLHILN